MPADAMISTPRRGRLRKLQQATLADLQTELAALDHTHARLVAETAATIDALTAETATAVQTVIWRALVAADQTGPDDGGPEAEMMTRIRTARTEMAAAHQAEGGES